jgi:hypothetical protein
MRAPWKTGLSLSILAIALGLGIGGCAAPEDAPADQGESSESGLSRTALSDAAIQGKLKGILKDASFTSEGDFGYVVFEGDAVAPNTKRLSTKMVREKLAAAIKANSRNRRDVLRAGCRASRLNVSSAIAEGDATVVPARDDDEWTYAYHDKQVGIALKTMRSQLHSVVGFTFGTNESGDQDEFGNVLYVYVGISKSTGKLIAIMTEAVYT